MPDDPYIVIGVTLFEIPTSGDSVSATFETSLEGVTWIFNITENPRDRRLYLTVTSPRTGVVVYTRKLVSNYPLLANDPFGDDVGDARPRGEIMVLDPSDRPREPTLDGLGATHRILTIGFELLDIDPNDADDMETARNEYEFLIEGFESDFDVSLFSGTLI